MQNSRTCEFSNVIVHRASFVKHSRNRKHLENIMIIPEWFFKEKQAPIKKHI